MLSRRGLLVGLGVALAVPAIVRFESLMLVRRLPLTVVQPRFLVQGESDLVSSVGTIYSLAVFEKFLNEYEVTTFNRALAYQIGM